MTANPDKLEQAMTPGDYLLKMLADIEEQYGEPPDAETIATLEHATDEIATLKRERDEARAKLDAYDDGWSNALKRLEQAEADLARVREERDEAPVLVNEGYGAAHRGKSDSECPYERLTDYRRALWLDGHSLRSFETRAESAESQLAALRGVVAGMVEALKESRGAVVDAVRYMRKVYERPTCVPWLTEVWDSLMPYWSDTSDGTTRIDAALYAAGAVADAKNG